MSDFATVEQAIEDIKSGKMVVVVDDEDRENEGDLIIAGDFVTPEAINFMATNAKGLICTPIDGARLDELDISPMVANNTDNHETAFTVSIDAYDTETGISAYERCQTVKALMDPKSKPATFRRPGHVFPLRSVEGGVLRRAGHTETTTDLAKLAGLKPYGLCCEIMDDDGHMMRTPKLKEFAKKHGLHIITVQSLIEYRKRTENFVKEVANVDFPSKYGHFRIHAYENTLNSKCDLAVVKGDVRGKKNVLVRVHSECLTGDALGSLRCNMIEFQPFLPGSFNIEYIYNHWRLVEFEKYATLVIRTIFDMLMRTFSYASSGKVGLCLKYFPLLRDSWEDWLVKHSNYESAGTFDRTNAIHYDTVSVFDCTKGDSYTKCAIEYISGMTDQFAIAIFNEIISF